MDKLRMNDNIWKWTDHIYDQMDERKIAVELIEDALANPDEVVKGKGDRIIYQKIVKEKLLRVVTESNRLITVYVTSKMNKYSKKGDKP